jgi:hypothetical protein
VRNEDLGYLFQRQPCPVLRLYLTGGMLFEIRDPDQVVVTRTTVEILLPADGTRDREAVISLLHIIWVEVVTPST